jgi:hypothetical protein
MKTPSHPWSFRQRLRARAFGWRGSKLAIERLKEALGELETVARDDPETAAEGAILLMERQLDRLWTAIEEDGVDFLSEVRDRWGELYGVQALAAQGRTDEAIRYAEQSLGLNDGPSDMARTCEEILLAAGRGEEAYRRFAYTANRAGSHLATFRAIKKKYSDKAPRAILDDLIAQTPGEEGKWFATAKTLGLLDLARGSPVDIGTLLRAARDLQESNPRFALQAAVAALRWMVAGRFYELRAGDVWDARRFALETAEVTGQAETIQAFLDELTSSADTDTFVRQQLEAPYGVRRLTPRA